MESKRKYIVFNNVLRKKSLDHQTLKLQEEILELQIELIRQQTKRNELNCKSLIDEIADFIIMCEQWIYYNFGEQDIKKNMFRYDYNNIMYSFSKIISYLNNNCNTECEQELKDFIKHHVISCYTMILDYVKQQNIINAVEFRISTKLKMLDQRVKNGDL